MRIRVDLRRRLDLEGLEHGQLILTYRCFARLMVVEAPDVPLILGWAGCLDRAKLVLDTPHTLALRVRVRLDARHHRASLAF